ncbi:hypothetical protein Poli38472_007764 [Pythium oligandrum]|uniref:Uncharacterized protein n=1 Tax=Pythium oligandrum TaxID=41045 RepID=A0A8K1CQS2_PYTOL|nr:hypothetical protein Poli38472_007764 [Pythium oligandrum]|eukprot:TMW68092.1 hypothetical protein Poli38472_007764 [Pythium oligandrum]
MTILSMTSSYRVAHDARKGRCALATKPLRAGTRLLRTTPFAAVSVSACNACFSSNSPLKRCGGCRLVRYCSRTCQQSDWTHGGHGKECAAWTLIPTDNKAPETVLLVTRLASALFLTPAGDQAANEQVLVMPHHFDDHTPEKRGEFLEMAQLVLLLLSRSKLNTNALSFEQLQDKYEAAIQLLFARLNCNAFTICEGASQASIGIGVFPEAALLNHSCDPNCVVSFVPKSEGKRPTVQLCIQVVQDVQEGDELTISYVELLESSKKRQLALPPSLRSSAWSVNGVRLRGFSQGFHSLREDYSIFSSLVFFTTTGIDVRKRTTIFAKLCKRYPVPMERITPWLLQLVRN